MTTLEITAIYHGERFRFANGQGDVIIGDVEHVDKDKQILCPTNAVMFAVKGPEDESLPLTEHRTYRFYGRWSKYKNKRSGKTEDQFHFSTYVEAEPASRAGVIAYLKEAGRGNGIGQGIAAKIWERFGSDSVKILREKPDVVAAAINRLSEESAKVVASVLKERQATEHCTVELMGLLDRRGFPKTTAKRAIAIWGNQAAELIKNNPFALMRFRGCGFVNCDRMYLELGLDPQRLKRQALCAWHSISSDTNGHTWLPAAYVTKCITEKICGARVDPAKAIKLACRAGLLDKCRVEP